MKQEVAIALKLLQEGTPGRSSSIPRIIHSVQVTRNVEQTLGIHDGRYENAHSFTCTSCSKLPPPPQKKMDTTL